MNNTLMQVAAWRTVAMLCATCAPASAWAVSDEIIQFDGFDGCDPVQATIGAEGGTVRLCGAQLSVPPGTVSQPSLFGIERLSEPPPIPFDMELAGAAFRFTSDASSLATRVSVRVPRGDDRRGGLAVFAPDENALVLIEACQTSSTGVQQFVNGLGTFAAIRYVGELPENTLGLGDGTVTTTMSGTVREFDLDRPGHNFAVYQDLPDGSRQVLVNAMNELRDGQFDFVRLDLVTNAATGSGGLAQISVLGTTSGSFIEGILGTASITFGDLSDGRVRAHIQATLASGPTSVPFEATLDVGVERFIFPPELSCPKNP